MNLLGIISGVLPNMDCVDDNAPFSPSQNWYYNLDENWYPWGRQWRFKIKMWISDYPTAIVEQWFCIRIHNNWSLDRDNFQPPFEYEEPNISIEYDTRLEEIKAGLCLDCVQTQTSQRQIEDIPCLCNCDQSTQSEDLIVLNFIRWYRDIIDSEIDSPDIQKFIDEFSQTDFYKSLINKSGIEDTNLSSLELEKIRFDALIKTYEDKLKDGRREEDIDHIMLKMRDEENQLLPLTILSQTGAILSIDL